MTIGVIGVFIKFVATYSKMHKQIALKLCGNSIIKVDCVNVLLFH